MHPQRLQTRLNFFLKNDFFLKPGHGNICEKQNSLNRVHKARGKNIFWTSPDVANCTSLASSIARCSCCSAPTEFSWHARTAAFSCSCMSTEINWLLKPRKHDRHDHCLTVAQSTQIVWRPFRSFLQTRHFGAICLRRSLTSSGVAFLLQFSPSTAITSQIATPHVLLVSLKMAEGVHKCHLLEWFVIGMCTALKLIAPLRRASKKVVFPVRP